ncbi:MAG: 50S ribosomal protein L22 [Candidatus Binatia bacterium]|jgi:large subunit ribosomal protein L22|nr:50S ribosomal protein L22 [Candidatus Binatia bacterium]MDG1958060.1 50S ribosomal protein L22 [Candidatus Binatia bacterium]MDG2011240.1 50S ribosomal protein L22 [Candidatus Binatia bacterium]|tara:strand:- start:54 stop:401 length:348 start_codon:yes stop_codon:yes gene_type:complete
METRASTRFVRISPQKARLIVDMIRGRKVEEALSVLEFTPKKAARIVAKTLRSAVANAEDTKNVDVDELIVTRCWVDEGPTLKRMLPRAQGRATKINKRSSHITVIVDEKQTGQS